MDRKPRSRRSFLATALTRAAALWVAVTGGLAAVLSACEERRAPEPPLYGAPRDAVTRDPGPPLEPKLAGSAQQGRREAPLYGAAPRRPVEAVQPPPSPPAALYGAPPPPPKYGAPPLPRQPKPSPKPQRDS
jgi:hypothetical protein